MEYQHSYYIILKVRSMEMETKFHELLSIVWSDEIMYV